jgi:hypothetical protein
MIPFISKYLSQEHNFQMNNSKGTKQRPLTSYHILLRSDLEGLYLDRYGPRQQIVA